MGSKYTTDYDLMRRLIGAEDPNSSLYLSEEDITVAKALTAKCANPGTRRYELALRACILGMQYIRTTGKQHSIPIDQQLTGPERVL
jgi:hypothetical protein